MNFYFYDLETTGLEPFRERIMQFGGQSVDANLQPLSDMEEFYIKLSEDILPSPQAILVHKILPQMCNLEGLSEYQFLNWLDEHVYQSSPIYSGYNIINFDNQFMRWLHWRNFAPIAPMLTTGASFDIYRLLRLTADLRPDGLNWIYDPKRQTPSLTLSKIIEANQIKTSNLHTAGNDVLATIEVARLVKKVQPKLFEHSLKLLQADFVKDIISSTQQPFIYNHIANLGLGAATTLATVLAEHPTRVGCYIVYDLRENVAAWQNLDAASLSLRLKKSNLKGQAYLPFSILDINQAPMVAPFNVLDKTSGQRLKLDKRQIFNNWQALQQSKLPTLISQAYTALLSPEVKFNNWELALAKTKMSANDELKRQEVRQTKPQTIAQLSLDFEDARWKDLQFLYQARNFPKTLKTDQLIAWEKYRQQIFASGQSNQFQIFKKQLRQALQTHQGDASVINILEELQFYIENILPENILK